jgi:uncharacterized protein YeaO (DUF488 family)
MGVIRTKRVYESSDRQEGARFLVERLWPRGVKKTALPLDDWAKDVAPSDGLRRWFHHEPARWTEFKHRYWAELDAHPDAWRPILEAAHRGSVTLYYSARDTACNSAVALKEYLSAKLKGPAAQ